MSKESTAMIAHLCSEFPVQRHFRQLEEGANFLHAIVRFIHSQYENNSGSSVCHSSALAFPCVTVVSFWKNKNESEPPLQDAMMLSGIILKEFKVHSIVEEESMEILIVREK